MLQLAQTILQWLLRPERNRDKFAREVPRSIHDSFCIYKEDWREQGDKRSWEFSQIRFAFHRVARWKVPNECPRGFLARWKSIEQRVPISAFCPTRNQVRI